MSLTPYLEDLFSGALAGNSSRCDRLRTVISANGLSDDQVDAMLQRLDACCKKGMLTKSAADTAYFLFMQRYHSPFLAFKLAEPPTMRFARRACLPLLPRFKM